jgi:hypothetical protein
VIVFVECAEVFLQTPRTQILGYEAFNLDSVYLDLKSHLSCKNDQLARYVDTRQVQTRIWFCISKCKSFADDLREIARTIERVEDVRKSAREHTLDLDDLITCFNQTAKRVNDREPGADICFVKKVSLVFASRFAEAAVSSEWSGVTLLVRCDDVDASRHPTLVVLWQLAARRCVDDHCMWQVIGLYVIDEFFEIGIRSTFIQLTAPTVEKKLSVMKYHLPAVHDAAHSQVDTAFGAQFLNPSGELVQKRSTNQSCADHTDRKSLTRKIKGGVQRSQCLGRFVLFDDGRDVSFRRPLCDCSDVDPGFAKRAEKLPGHSESFNHALADHSDDAATLS